jgi:8-oxo-dGTP pyrophosphatase MutT (NUDIX family)
MLVIPNNSDNPTLVPSTEHLVYETPWIDLYYDDITHPNGESGNYAWVKSHSGNGAVMTIPVTPSGKILLVRVYRHPIKRYLWEFPAGIMDAGESPEETGRRELIEETGVTPTTVELLGSQTPIAGYVGYAFHSLVAEIPEITIDDVTLQREESIADARLLYRRELIEMLDAEEIGEGVTLTCLARYWMWQELKTKARGKDV